MTIEEFQPLSTVLTEPYKTMATVAVCVGLRWSELVGLMWKDIGWLNGKLRLQRAVVKQIEDEVKTVHSSKPLALDIRILDLLKAHNQNSISRTREIGSSPHPRSMGSCRGPIHRFGRSWDVRVTMLESFTFRPTAFGHSYRAWLDELGTPITVQQRAMRHGDIRVTVNYGDAVGEVITGSLSEVAARAYHERHVNGM